MGYSSVLIPVGMPAGGSEFAQELRVNRVLRFSSDLNSDHRALQRHKCSSVVDVLTPTRYTLLSTLFCAHCPIDIALIPAFCGLRNKGHMVCLDFDKYPGNDEEKPSIGFAIT